MYVNFRRGSSIVHGGNNVHRSSVTDSGPPFIKSHSGSPGEGVFCLPSQGLYRRFRLMVNALTVQKGKVGKNVSVIFSNWSSAVHGGNTVPKTDVSNYRS